MGVLTVVSGRSGLIENAIDGKTGWIVPKRQPVLLAKKIKQIISMKNKKLNTISLNGIKRVRNKFDLKKQKKHFNRFFNEKFILKKNQIINLYQESFMLIGSNHYFQNLVLIYME